MNQESLRELLERVHERLSGGSVDPQSRELLATVMRDIEHALNPSGAAKPAAKAEPTEVLEGLAVRFESEHPALAGVLRQLIDALGKAGI
jgi:predicted component of type VI protein secretion system